MAGVHKYKDGVVSGLYKGLQGLVAAPQGHRHRGRGPAVVADLRRGERPALQGRHVLLATGSVPKSLPGLEIDGNRIISSDHALVLDRVPQSAIVLGGGVIGVEFASAWKSFGTDVTIVEALPHLVPAEDETARSCWSGRSASAASSSTSATSSRRPSTPRTACRVTLADGKTFEAELLLVAVGRGPVSPGLGYEEQGVAMDRGYVLADEHLRTNVPTVSAVGDLVPGLQLAHVGFAEGIFVAERLAGLNPAVIDDDGVPRVTYCHPEVASVGITEAKAKELYGADKVEALKYNLGGNGKSKILKTAGEVKLVQVQGRCRGRRPHGRRPDGRAGRRGPADLQLGGAPGRGRAAHPRPPDAERGARRGPPGPGRQAAALPRLTTTIRGVRRTGDDPHQGT